MKKLSVPFCIALFYSAFVLSAAHAQCPKGRPVYGDKNGNAMNYSLNYEIEPNTKFKIKLANTLNSGIYRTGDTVKFTVIENVYGRFKTRTLPKDFKLSDDQKFADDIQEGELMVVIPKDTQGFGRINYSKPRSTLYYRGKAKIYFSPEYVQMDDGRCVEVTIPTPDDTNFEGLGLPQNVKPCKNPPENLKNPKGKRKAELIDAEDENPNLPQCIEGRRQQILVGKGIVGAIAAAGLAITKDKATSSVAGLTLVGTASSDDGIGALLSGNEAEILDTMIMEVEISPNQNKQGFIRGKAPEKVKP